MGSAVLLLLLVTRLALFVHGDGGEGAARVGVRSGIHTYHYYRHRRDESVPTIHKLSKSRGEQTQYGRLCTEEMKYKFEDLDVASTANSTVLMRFYRVQKILEEVEVSSVPTVRLELHGLPCAKQGCCNFTILLRPKGSDVEVLKRVINEYSEVLFKVLPYVKITSILDAGGNIGIASVFFAHLFPSAKIVALEPETTNCLLLKANTLALPNVRVHCKGLWNHAARVEVTKGSKSMDWGWRTTEVENGTTGAVVATTVIELLEMYHLESFDFVKLDVEGAEFQILGDHADLKWLNKTQILATEIHRKWGSTDQFKQLKANMANYGFLGSPSGEYEIFTRQDLHSKLI